MNNVHLILAWVILACATPSAFAQTALATIRVSGSAQIDVAPDEIYIRVGVESRDEDLQTATQDHNERVSKTLEFLKGHGIERKHIQTDYIHVEPEYDHRHSRVKPVAYIVRKSIEIKLLDVEKFDQLMTGLLAHGANHVHGVDFRSSELREHRDKARALAIRAAKEKAEALAAELGAEIGKVQSIDASEWGGWLTSYYQPWRGGMGGHFSQNVIQDAGGPPAVEAQTVSVGQINISAQVNVVFLLEQ